MDPAFLAWFFQAKPKDIDALDGNKLLIEKFT
jgi:hypothetical protein